MFAELLQPLGLAEVYGVAFNESGILFEVRRFLSCSLHPEDNFGRPRSALDLADPVR